MQTVRSCMHPSHINKTSGLSTESGLSRAVIGLRTFTDNIFMKIVRIGPENSWDPENVSFLSNAVRFSVCKCSICTTPAIHHILLRECMKCGVSQVCFSILSDTVREQAKPLYIGALHGPAQSRHAANSICWKISKVLLENYNISGF